MDGSVAAVYYAGRSIRLSRPLLMWRIPAGFPSPAEDSLDYVELRVNISGTFQVQ